MDYANLLLEHDKLKAEIKSLSKQVAEYEEAIEQASEFIGQIPLHSEDKHTLHFVKMAQNWLSSPITAMGDSDE